MKLHNPKSHMPAVYIPCWLIQIHHKLLSHAAKMLYGRLAQWSNETGIVFRSGTKLAQELGVSRRDIVRYLKELKDAKLIGTHLNQVGGQNNYEFYDHPWMHLPINQNLTYRSVELSTGPENTMTKIAHPWVNINPPPESTLTHPPESNLTHINKKLNRKNVCVGKNPTPTVTHTHFQQILEDKECLDLFISKFQRHNVLMQSLFDDCIKYYEQQGKKVTINIFKVWIENEKITNYPKKPSQLTTNVPPEERELLQNYKYNIEHPNLPQFQLTSEQVARAHQLLKDSALSKVPRLVAIQKPPSVSQNPIVIQENIESIDPTTSENSVPRTQQSQVMIEAMNALKQLTGKMRIRPQKTSTQERKYYSSPDKKTDAFPSISLAEYKALKDA